MTRVVVDASVVVKWIFPDPRREPHAGCALTLLEDIRADRVVAVQPAHWLAEVAAVTARLQPAICRETIGLLHAMELPVLDEPEIYYRACELAATLDQHVFDTLYHAVALALPDGVLLTADDRYWRKASGVGQVQRLRDYPRDG